MKYCWAAPIYRFFLRFLPTHLRQSHGHEMEKLFVETLAFETRRRGLRGSIAVVLGSTIDIVRWVVSERATSRSSLVAYHRSSPRRTTAVSRFLQELAQSAKSLSKSPALCGITVLTLALGLGSSIAIFSVVDFVLLRPLPFPDADRLYTVWENNVERGRQKSLVAPPTFVDWREMSESFTEMSLLSQGSPTLTGGAAPERVSAMYTSPSIFDLLGVHMHIGTAFPTESSLSDAGRLVVLSHGFWQNWFGADPDAVGRTLVLNDEQHTVVGVLPREFRFPETAELWLPQTFAPSQLTEGMRGARYLQVIARLRPDVPVSRAREEMSAIAEILGERHANNRGGGVTLTGLHDNMVSEYRRSLTLLLIGTALVLVIACVNVVNVVLARSSDRGRERAVRLALGASGWHLFKQSMMQHLLLSLVGGGVGAFAAFWAIPAMVQLAPAEIPRVADVAVDGRILLASLGISILVGLTLSIVSMWSSGRSDSFQAIRSSQIGATPARQRVRDVLVVTEVCLSLVLAIGAGLLLQSFVRLQNVDPGFASRGIMTVSLSLSGTRYGTDAQRESFFRELQNRLDVRQDIQSVALTTNLPLSGSAMNFGFSVDGRPEATLNEQASAEYHVVSPGYFRTMGIDLVGGRALAWHDDAVNAPVVLINETFAARYWPNEDPISKTITVVSRSGPTSREIVGVVGDVRHSGLASLPRVEVYVPLSQDPWAFSTLVLRTTDGTDAIRAVREELSLLDSSMPIGAVVPIERVVSRWLAPLRFQMILVGFFAVASLGLATLGIYGVIAYFVSLRTNEIGVRMALGANTGRVYGSVLGRGMLLALLGASVGIVVAFWTTRYLASLLYEISPSDPTVFLMSTALVLSVALLGSSLPARRAVRIDPVDALREA